MGIRIREVDAGFSLESILQRAKQDLNDTLSLVRPILEEVRTRGDEAVRDFTLKFDKLEPSSFYHPVPDWKGTADPELVAALEKAKENISIFHKAQMPSDLDVQVSGNSLGIRYTPIESVTVYAPGGKALYPSTILMGVIPAKIAGVKHIQIVTPPQKEGIPDGLFAAAKIAGADAIVTAGGAQGIAAASYGTKSIPRSEFVIGPGNKFVTAAKILLSGQGVIGIDSPAGPSEVLVIADDSANPNWVAADLLSQAEHGEDSAAILCTDSMGFAKKVAAEIDLALKERPKRADIKKASIENESWILVFPNLDSCVDFSNLYAPEHLEIQTKNYKELFRKIKHAGSVFLGPYSPVAMGDYISGTNHILPTAGGSRIFSSLGVMTFLKRVTYQEVTRDSLEKLYPYVKVLSEFEGLDEEHGNSVKVRLPKREV
ncbi:histidinol dehydrogenase [Leptospira langatensis]|uniref:Histidinol dehydrogenase n=1 Tax=Leptospira langatensis TaxID=2484983 RepID=A0A5F2A0T3_9LEPT|nr:histidinol dehydrogenase [Leptospira langatensis]TGJ98529.1 histidinol dehydrogenase [Leptospira langatensis]TGL43829.1 histidinol dehydrogenase [Leptospira langatensis]